MTPMKGAPMPKGGILLIKFWLEVGQGEQQRRFEARIEDSLRQWKLSPMDSSRMPGGPPARGQAT